MAVVSLPLSFNNSFWTPDYWKGLEVLFTKLEQGVAENDEIIKFVRARATAEENTAASLKKTAVYSVGSGFDADDGASLFAAFRGMKLESLAQGKAHEAVANDLNAQVADPFQKWAQGHKEKLKQAKSTAFESWFRPYESAQEHTQKLKAQFIAKVRRADESEDDARLISNQISDKFIDSPMLGPHGSRKAPARQPTVSERIAQRFRDFGKVAVSEMTGQPPQSEHIFDVDAEKTSSPKVDKGKGKAFDREILSASPPPLSSPMPPALNVAPASEQILLAGLSFNPSAIAQFLTQAKKELPLRAVRFPLLGEYQDCFSGEEFVTWLTENIPAFNRNLDLAAVAAKDLTEREDLLRRLGEFGNPFDNTDEAFYQFRPKAFTFGRLHEPQEAMSSPIQRIAPVADNLVKTSSNFVSIVSKALNTAPASEPPFVRLRREADFADREYREAVKKLDRQRLSLEEKIEELLRTLQMWETERLHTIKSALLQYQGCVETLRKSYNSYSERSATTLLSYNPESDLKALIERYRTGPFRPMPNLYESVVQDELDVSFGIDLRKWAEGGWSTETSGEERRDQVPSMLSTLFNALNDRYQKIPDDAEKRKVWIYEVPLTAVHHLRESLNAVPAGHDIPEDLLNKYTPPIIASTIKLWLLELDPPLGMYDGWDEVRKLYPQVGAAKPEGESELQRFEAIQFALQKLPKVHLFVIDALVHHLKELIDKTTTNESNEIYCTKLALSLGRGVIRPKVENQLSIQDRHSTLFFKDLIEHYDELLPPTITKKRRESERKIPTRKRTQIVDMRMRRSNLSDTTDIKEIIVAQHRGTSPRPKHASRMSDSSTGTSVMATSPESIKIQAPIAIQPNDQGLPPAFLVDPVVTASHSDFMPSSSPPPILTPPHVPAPVVPSQEQASALPPRPTFKEPPPEFDDLPPRPTFKEPPPEFDDLSRPTFVDPVDNNPSYKASESTLSSPDLSSPAGNMSPTAGATGLKRVTTSETSRMRGPRVNRVSRLAASPNKRDLHNGQTSPPSPIPPASRGHARPVSRGSISNVSIKRRSGSASSFSRTMASEAEVR